jgi:hypothetical protein
MNIIVIISTLYLVAQLLSLAFSWPQLHKLIIMKEADEMSLSTWSAWTLTQLVTTLYASVNHQSLWLGMSAMWLLFDIAMVLLILKYRRPQQKAEITIDNNQ